LTQKQTILLIEDESIISDIITFELTRNNFSVINAKTEPEGLKILTESSPDLIIADLNLSGGSGLNVLSKSNNQKGKLPVILITGHPNFSEIDAFRAGAADLIRKPFSRSQLADSVKNLLSPQLDQLSREPKGVIPELIHWNADAPFLDATKILKFGLGGIFVPTEKNLPKQNTMIQLVIHSKDTSPLDVVGRVRFIRMKPSCGFGLEVFKIEGSSSNLFKKNFSNLNHQLYLPVE
jgi:CheY-like chemotaxis protein